ncbi:hypothetical protein H2248_002727 [Termitomyces sp. 'cryptogamus']|nr:hypothetical protein H2248_002727 [Termitomyces sp. 'cryptogamus']
MSAAVIVIVFSGLSAASSGANGSVPGLLSMLSAMRFFLGIGVGAEYPCGSVAASEQSEEPAISYHARHRWLGLATITTLVFGNAVASFVPWVLYLIFGPDHLRAVWRLSLGLGIVPALIVLLWRLNMDEPMRYKSDSMKNTRIPYALVLQRYWPSLLAISVIWFILDIIVYVVPTPLGWCDSYLPTDTRITGGSQDLKIVFGWNVVISLFSFPGALSGSLVVDYLGPKWTLVRHSLPYTHTPTRPVDPGIHIPISNRLHHKRALRPVSKSQPPLDVIQSTQRLNTHVPTPARLTHHIAAFSILYGLFLTFAEFGAGLCTFIIAAKACPTAVRGHCFGVAAACGKAGAFGGVWVFPPIVKAFGGAGSVRGNTGPFWIASGLCVVGALVSVFFVHPLTQEGIEREDREFRAYLEMHGYDTRRMGTGTGTGTVGGSSSASASASGTGSSDGNGDEGEKRGDEGEKAV